MYVCMYVHIGFREQVSYDGIDNEDFSEKMSCRMVRKQAYVIETKLWLRKEKPSFIKSSHKHQIQDYANVEKKHFLCFAICVPLDGSSEGQNRSKPKTKK